MLSISMSITGMPWQKLRPRSMAFHWQPMKISESKAIEEVQEKMGYDELPDDITESEMFNHARKEIIKGFSGENIGGLYLVESLHDTAYRITQFLMDCELIDDVFGTDEDIATFLIKKIRLFSSKKN